MQTDQIEASFDQMRNDMFWKVWAGEDKFIRWGGYDDTYWWDNVSATDAFRERVGSVTGRRYRLDPETNTVSILPALADRLSA